MTKREALALSTQLAELLRSVVNYDKVGDHIFSDRVKGTVRQGSQKAKDALFKK